MLKFYDRNVAEGKGFLFFAVFFAVLIRLVYYFHFDTSIVVDEGGYLWAPLASILSNSLYSLLASAVMVVLIAIVINQVNTEHVFIRRRTLLPSAIVILLFSCMPSELAMSPYYIAALSMMLIIGALFEASANHFSQGSACKITFHLALGSLFAPLLILYLPVIWICMIRVRSLSVKAFLASVFTAALVYLPTYCYFLFTDNLTEFYRPFDNIFYADLDLLPILKYGVSDFVLLGLLLGLYLIIMIDNSINGFKDKIRVRTFSTVLTIIIFFSFLFTILLNVDSETATFIGLAAGALQVAHFFSLAEKKVVKILFVFYLLVLLGFSLVEFL